MNEQNNSNIFVWVLVLIIIVLGAAGYFGWRYFAGSKESKVSSSPTPASTISASTMKTYSNDTYGFSFKYPSTWQEKKLESDVEGFNKDLVFQVGFTDGERLREIEAQKENLTQILHERDVYVIVFKPSADKPLKDWMTEHYRALGGELADFTPGKEIELAGEKGYVANIGCCADYDLSYVVQKGDYVYQFGTNYSDADKDGRNTLLDELSKNFKFIQ